jgi:type 1 glutamine amidotransferase
MTLLVSAAAGSGAEPVRALLVTGWYDHSFLDPAPALVELLGGDGISVRATEKLTPEALDRADVLVVLYNGPRWASATEAAVERWMAGGGGMVTIHGATYAFGGVEVREVKFRRSGILEPPWEAFVRMIGCRWPEEKLGHGKRHQFAVRFTDRTHPIARELEESLTADDELYHRVEMLPHAHVLASAFSDPATGGTGRDEPMMWTTSFEKGRIFHTTLGHDPQAMRAPAFARPVVRAVEWAAGRR